MLLFSRFEECADQSILWPTCNLRERVFVYFYSSVNCTEDSCASDSQWLGICSGKFTSRTSALSHIPVSSFFCLCIFMMHCTPWRCSTVPLVLKDIWKNEHCGFGWFLATLESCAWAHKSRMLGNLFLNGFIIKFIIWVWKSIRSVLTSSFEPNGNLKWSVVSQQVVLSECSLNPHAHMLNCPWASYCWLVEHLTCQLAATWYVSMCVIG